jgi:hypothetical protein
LSAGASLAGRALIRGLCPAIVSSPVGNSFRSSIDVFSLQTEIDDSRNTSRMRGLGKLNLPFLVDQAPRSRRLQSASPLSTCASWRVIECASWRISFRNSESKKSLETKSPRRSKNSASAYPKRCGILTQGEDSPRTANTTLLQVTILQKLSRISRLKEQLYKIDELR